MDLSAIAIHPVVSWEQQPWSGQPPETAPEQVAGNGGGLPEPERHRDTYEPTAVPGSNGEVPTQYATGRPESNIPTGGNEYQDAAVSDSDSITRFPKMRGAAGSAPGLLELTAEEKAEVARLRARDAEVRAHEMAHIMAGGRYIIRRAQFEYVLGPDGRLYAVGGDVVIDTSPVPGDPEATIRKAQAIRRAALAPSNPSGQDLRVAAEATRMEFEARMELARQRAEEALEQAEEYNQDGEAITPEPEPFLLNLFA